MGAIILINIVQWMPCLSRKFQLLPALSWEEIDFATLHHALGDANQFAVKSIISLGEIESATFVQVWLVHTAKTQNKTKHIQSLYFTLFFLNPRKVGLVDICFVLLLTLFYNAVWFKTGWLNTNEIFYSRDGSSTMTWVENKWRVWINTPWSTFSFTKHHKWPATHTTWVVHSSCKRMW